MNENYIKNIIFSSKYFNGFIVKIDIRYTENINDIINYSVNNLLEILKKYNFENLIDILNNTKFHIHTHNYEEILLTNDIIYVCDCE